MLKDAIRVIFDHVQESLSMDDAIDETGLQRTESGHFEWQKNHDQHPRNWASYRKCYDTVIVVFFEFYTYVKAIAPARKTQLTKSRTVISTTGVCT